jgi:acid stress-induced BolA-like protein IbaG/YrbA
VETVRKVKRALKRAFNPEIVNLEDDEGIIGVVVSDQFRRMESIDRQMSIDNALRDPLSRLSEDEIRHVLAITPMTPEEYVALGQPRGRELRGIKSRSDGHSLLGDQRRQLAHFRGGYKLPGTGSMKDAVGIQSGRSDRLDSSLTM